MPQFTFFICNSKQRAKRTVVRRHKNDTHTQFQPTLNCFAYECSDYAEFKELQERIGCKEGWFAGFLIKKDDGTFRLPEANDLVTKMPSPAAPAEVGKVVVTSSQPEEGTLSPEPEVDFGIEEAEAAPIAPPDNPELNMLVLAQLREHITQFGTKRLNGMAVHFNVSQDDLRELIAEPDSGLFIKQAGWIALSP